MRILAILVCAILGAGLSAGALILGSLAHALTQVAISVAACYLIALLALARFPALRKTGPLCALLISPAIIFGVGVMMVAEGKVIYRDMGPRPKEYEQACLSAGVRFERLPAKPARSVAMDFKPAPIREFRRRLELGPRDRLERVGTLFWQPRLEHQAAFFELRAGGGDPKDAPRFFRFESQGGRSGPASPVSEMSADVLAEVEISDLAQLDLPLWSQGLVSYTITVTDRRDGELLGSMRYSVDASNKRACGANVKGAIDVDAFVLKAAGIPVVIPEHELQRRSRALIKNW